MNNRSGEVIIGALIGLAIGAIALMINSGNWAQEEANRLGQPVKTTEYLREKPAMSALTLLGPPLAGAGIAYAIDQASGSSGSKGSSSTAGRDSTTIIIEGDGNVVQVRGDATTIGGPAGE